jgi:hypothetical protein
MSRSGNDEPGGSPRVVPRQSVYRCYPRVHGFVGAKVLVYMPCARRHATKGLSPGMTQVDMVVFDISADAAARISGFYAAGPRSQAAPASCGASCSCFCPCCWPPRCLGAGTEFQSCARAKQSSSAARATLLSSEGCLLTYVHPSLRQQQGALVWQQGPALASLSQRPLPQDHRSTPACLPLPIRTGTLRWLADACVTAHVHCCGQPLASFHKEVSGMDKIPKTKSLPSRWPAPPACPTEWRPPSTPGTSAS